MGTSKGYITPTTPKWSNAKRGVTAFTGNPSLLNKKEASSRFAKAIKADDKTIPNTSVVFSNIASFVSTSKTKGLKQALEEYDKSYINDLSPEEALNELINSFCEGNTIDDVLANNCISEALDVLEIDSLDDLSTIDINELIKELTCQFATQKFAQSFDKHIREKCDSIIVANERLKDIQDYIYYTLKNSLTTDKLDLINPHNLASEQIIIDIINEAFSILENYYE